MIVLKRIPLYQRVKLRSSIFSEIPKFDGTIELDEFLDEVRNCKKCQICKYAPTPPEIRQNSILCWFRNPGRTEAKTGIPIHPAAKAGAIFKEYLYSWGISRERVSITNTIFCYTQNDRPPYMEEIMNCVLRHKPKEFTFYKNVKLIFLFGNDAFRTVTLRSDSVIGSEYTIFTHKGRVFVPLYHPGYVLRRKRSFQEAYYKHLERYIPLIEKVIEGRQI